MAVFACIIVLDQRTNCPLDAPQASAHSGLSVVTNDACVNAGRLNLAAVRLRLPQQLHFSAMSAIV